MTSTTALKRTVPFDPALSATLRRRLSSYAPNTQSALASDWRVWQRWHAAQGRGARQKAQGGFPATAEDLQAFIYSLSPPLFQGKDGAVRMDRGATGPGIRSARTVSRYLSSLKTLHRLAELDLTAFGHPDVLHALRTISRGRMATKPRAPFRLAELERLLKGRPVSLREVRDQALAAVAYFGLLRRSEVVALLVDDIAEDEDGSGTITIRRSKTDQAGEGQARYLAPVGIRAVRRWLKEGHVKDGPLFRRIMPDGRVVDEPMRAQEVARIMKRLAARVGMDPTDIAGHSMRIGAAHDLVAAGFGLPAVMQAGGWKAPGMPAMYTRELAAKQSAMASLVGAAGAKRRGRQGTRSP